ncbi:hypothetical protein CDCA_CDCA08G2496 [Cyanidium caldarium]|uniref:USP domain-containing protein n=1 Tax=Cyanidium caldarium TaxID=2771 RepID=A0AAV9IWM6_CYACA|nr:hypothetical protein CDCA_CDCA08G2496 [Cyanidium caldarium]
MEVFCVPTNESTVLSGVSPTTTGAPPDPITRVRWLQRDHHHRDDAPGWVLPDDAERYQGSACEALVFCGTQSGCVRSRVVPTAAAYAAWAGASLPVATAATAAVRAPDGIRALDVMCSDVDAAHDLILSASWDGVLVRRRTGAPVHSLLAADHWVEARCVCASPVSGHAMAFVTTDRGYMHMLDVLRGRSVRTTSSAPAAQRTLVACWGQPQAVVLGHDDGSVSVRDASTLAVMQREPLAVVRSTLRMPVADLAMRPDVSQALVCFGVSPLLRLYDIRVSATRSAGNVPAIVQETTVGSGDSVVAVRRVDGARHSGWLALGASGTVQRVSMAAAPEEAAMVAVLDTEGDLCTCLDVSPDGRHMAVGDTGGMLHVWQLPASSDTADGDAGMTAALEAGAVAFEREWHEALRPAAERPPPCVCVPPTAPLLSEMPLQRRRTLPGSVASDHRRWHFPERLSAEALKAARFVQSVGYLTAADAIALLLPDPQPGEEPMRWTGEELPPPSPVAPLWERLRYRKIDLARAESVDGFDFAAHNRTPYCGLENALPSSYINAAIQMLYFVRPFRRAMEHAAARFPATPESMEVNLAAELGHLFRMMNRGAGQACQATQLMRALRGTPQAMALQLVDHPTETGASAGRGSGEAPRMGVAARRIDKFLRYLLEQVAHDELVTSVVDALFGAEVVIRTRAVADGSESVQRTRQYVLTVYREMDAGAAGEAETMPSLSTAVQRSLHRRWGPIRALHKSSHQVELVHQVRDVQSLPPVLLCSCGEDAGPVEQVPRTLELAATEAAPRAYELVAVIVAVAGSSEAADASLVAFIQVDTGEASEDEQESGWYCFNDFTITPMPDVAEVTHFPDSRWRPVILAYRERRSKSTVAEWQLPPPPPPPPLPSREAAFALHPLGAAHRRLLRSGNESSLRQQLSFVPLQPEEPCGRGTIVALDAEFVLLSREQADIVCCHRSDTRSEPGDLSVQRQVRVPASKGVARLTVLRENGVPLMDDYVMPPADEPVIDYVTRYSGIRAEDLQPARTRHYLTWPKYAYAKLYYLLEAGCVFVGHGLKSDFRALSLLVPDTQRADTALLFRKPPPSSSSSSSKSSAAAGHRLLSLRFLAACLLGRTIQTAERGHDSLEDARAALDLYRMYQELERHGRLAATVDTLYEYGLQHRWQYDAREPFRVPE